MTGFPVIGRLQMLALTAFLERFESPGFEFGTWGGGERLPSGVLTMPYFEPSQDVVDFRAAAYTNGWVHDFDWPAWSHTPEALELRDKPAALAAASVEQLQRLMTVMIRQERFVDGSLEAHYKSGLLTRVLKRIAELAAIS
jgi:hypothetical protein